VRGSSAFLSSGLWMCWVFRISNGQMVEWTFYTAKEIGGSGILQHQDGLSFRIPDGVHGVSKWVALHGEVWKHGMDCTDRQTAGIEIRSDRATEAVFT